MFEKCECDVLLDDGQLIFLFTIDVTVNNYSLPITNCLDKKSIMIFFYFTIFVNLLKIRDLRIGLSITKYFYRTT